MNITEEHVIKALSTVMDPDLNKDLVSLNMIRDIKIDGNKIAFVVVLTTPACPLKEMIKNDCLNALHSHIGEDIEIDMDITSEVTTTRLKDAPILPDIKNIIAIASGKGGVGKSTVTANLAVSLAKNGAKVGLVDADIFGPSLPTMFNCENEQPSAIEKDGKPYIVPIEQYGVKLISIGFLAPADNAVVWRGPMASSALRQFFTDTDWGELDYLLVDLPPGTSDIHLTLVQAVPVTGAVIVTTPQKIALADAIKGTAMFKQAQINVPILGVIENMSYFTPAELPDKKYYIFGEGGGKQLCEKFDVPLLAQIPLVQDVRESSDNGYPIVLKEDLSAKSFDDAAKNLAQQIAIRNATKPQTEPVEITTA